MVVVIVEAISIVWYRFFLAKIPESDPKVEILNFSNNLIFTLRNVLERITGIEPVSLAWEAKVIPLYDIRFTSRQ